MLKIFGVMALSLLFSAAAFAGCCDGACCGKGCC